MPPTLTSDVLQHTTRQAVELAVALNARPATSTVKSTLLTGLRGIADHGSKTSVLASFGYTTPPEHGPGEFLLRVLPYTLITPLDRPQLRRTAFRVAQAGGADEGAGITAIATAFIAADLLRFDLPTTLLRVHQSLLEEAPTLLLQELLTPTEHPPARKDGDALQVLLGALALVDGRGIDGLLRDNDVFDRTPITAMLALWLLVTHATAFDEVTPLTESAGVAADLTSNITPMQVTTPPIFTQLEGTPV